MGSLGDSLHMLVDGRARAMGLPKPLGAQRIMGNSKTSGIVYTVEMGTLITVVKVEWMK